MLAIVAAVAGTGYASGRELVLFFAQTGRAQWIGIGFAPVVFGLLTALLCRCGAGMGANSIAVLCKRLMGKRMGAVAGWLHGLLLALTAVVMLCGAGEMGALALPVRYGWLWGAGIALLIALLVNLSGLRPLPWLGLIALTAGVMFYGALAMDPRSPRVWMEGAIQLALEDSWPASILLALAYAAMNAALAANVVLGFGSGTKPWRVGLGCALSLWALLAAANWAIERGGRRLLGQAMPTVVLAARWGLTGFWICAGFGYLCAVTTLSAALSGLIGAMRGGGHKGGLLTALAMAALTGLLGIRRTVGVSYPVVSWLCAALMLSLACRADALLFRSGKG
jgi:uncharacterized membrane protein YkvI